MTCPERIAIVEDDTILREELKCFFEGQACVVYEANSHASLLDVMQTQTVDAVLLDVNLPGMHGFDIAQKIRAASSHLVIVMLTAKTSTFDKVRGYQVGADVYFPKPADPTELLAAVKSLVGRARTKAVNGQGLSLSVKQLTLCAPGSAPLALSAVEAALLKALVFSTSQTLDTVDLQNVVEERFTDRPTTRRALENTLSRLRKKLMQHFEMQADPIKSVRGFGYQLTWLIEVID